MNKLVAGYMSLFVLMVILSSIMEGGGGFATTEIRTAVDNDDVIIPVDSTQGFLTADYIVIGDEEIAYTGVTVAPAASFTGCTRGWEGSEAVAHELDENVYSPDSGVLNTALGFNIASTGATAGIFTVVTLTFSFISKALPNIILWNFSFFSGLSPWEKSFLGI